MATFFLFFSEIYFILKTDRQCHLLTQTYLLKQNEKRDHYRSKKTNTAGQNSLNAIQNRIIFYISSLL